MQVAQPWETRGQLLQFDGYVFRNVDGHDYIQTDRGLLRVTAADLGIVADEIIQRLVEEEDHPEFAQEDFPDEYEDEVERIGEHDRAVYEHENPYEIPFDDIGEHLAPEHRLFALHFNQIVFLLERTEDADARRHSIVLKRVYVGDHPQDYGIALSDTFTAAIAMLTSIVRDWIIGERAEILVKVTGDDTLVMTNEDEDPVVQLDAAEERILYRPDTVLARGELALMDDAVEEMLRRDNIRLPGPPDPGAFAFRVLGEEESEEESEEEEEAGPIVPAPPPRQYPHPEQVTPAYVPIRECPLCWDVFERRVWTQCRHAFCYQCIQQAMAQHPEHQSAPCPICRSAIITLYEVPEDPPEEEEEPKRKRDDDEPEDEGGAKRQQVGGVPVIRVSADRLNAWLKKYPPVPKPTKSVYY